LSFRNSYVWSVLIFIFILVVWNVLCFRIGRDVDAHLAKLGGVRAFDYGEGDDSGTLEDDFEAWKAKFWPSIISQFHPTSHSTASDEANDKAILSFRCRKTKPSKAKIPPMSQIQHSNKFFFTAPTAKMTLRTELRAETNTGSTVHLEIDIKGTGLEYKTADNLAVLHENTPEVVELFATTCGGYDLDQCVALEAAEDVDEEDFKHPFPSPCSARHLLTHYVDIQGIPRKSVLAQFNAYLSDPAQQEWLKDITSLAQKERYLREIEQEGRSFVSLLARELSSCSIPLEDLLHIVPTIQPRDYTIASSSSVHPDSIHLTVSVTERTSPSGVKVEGLCSNFLKRLMDTGAQSSKMFVRESSFRLPKSLSTPIVMIGPGSGIAPMRALLQERQFLAKKENKTDVVNVLYFGCRSREVDFLYQDELRAAENDGSLSSLQLAFSREQDAKVYVQDVMQRPENASSLCDLVLEQGAYVYVCGATGMGQSVHEAFAHIFAAEKGITVAAANDLIKGMQKKHTYVQELWSI
jgi:NADPH-ferrihemoprotein reductase